MTASREQVIQAIESAFADVPYPGDRNIGSDPDYWECAEINGHFGGRHWKDVPRDILQYHQHDHPFFSPAGMHYYLPTYLIAALDRFGDTLEFTFYEINPPAEGHKHREDWAKRYDPMTPAQKNAIRMWLGYLRDEMSTLMEEEARASLEKYWGRDWE